MSVIRIWLLSEGCVLPVIPVPEQADDGLVEESISSVASLDVEEGSDPVGVS
jgi:hypothetical protein